MEAKIKYLIALSRIKGIGFRKSHQIMTEFGEPDAFFNLCKENSQKIPPALRAICTKEKISSALEWADLQIQYCRKNSIEIIGFFDKNYPYRLKRYEDGPLILYCKGHMDLNSHHTVGIVGTRKMTVYGKLTIEKIIPGLKTVNAVIISGLAYGVDSHAHRESIRHGMQTIGVMGTGIDQIYPPANRNLARDMQPKGGIITEFGIRTKPDAFNFPLRNRIIAALSDALIVIESKATGGAMITADLALDYNKDVFAIPGKTSDPYSTGTNALIKSQRAQLAESADDIIAAMNWSREDLPKTIQPSLFQDLSENERKLLQSFDKNMVFHIEEILQKLQLSNSDTAALLLNLELKGMVKNLPGNRYLIV